MDWTTTWHDLTSLDIPLLEKALRTFLVYAGLVLLLRLAGKRVLSQLNTFDLVVVLLLSNVVQNAVIGPDNSLLGGLLGACFLIMVNALWERLATASDGTARFIQGTPTVLVQDGVPDREAIVRVGLRLAEVEAALRRQGADQLEEVKQASLEPGGAISMELIRDARDVTYGELRAGLEELRAHIDKRLAALESTVAAAVRAAPSPPVSPPGPSAAG
ncbi:MAG: DUF421 domain-containing protein [Actinomycetales bacterium]